MNVHVWGMCLGNQGLWFRTYSETHFELAFHSRSLPTSGRKAMSTVVSATVEVSKGGAHGRHLPTELGVRRGRGLFPRKLSEENMYR